MLAGAPRFVLDITKCFNAFPRQPIKKLLIHLGTPPCLAEAWIQCLARLQRASSFSGDISEGHFSTTGIPEGDAISVAAAIAACWLLASVLEEYGVQPALFVDNWSWSTEGAEFNGYALVELLSVVSALRLTIDWSKSFGWARDKLSLKWWRQIGSLHLPPHIPLRLLADAKDLGTAMRYRGPKVLGCAKDRVTEGVRRLKCLKFQPRPLANKAYIIQAAIWPTIFYGTEGHCLSAKNMMLLRTEAARALLGSHSHTNPFLALSLLSPGLQDPELYYMTSVIRCVQRALRNMPAVGAATLGCAHTSSGSPYRVFGPGSSLKALLCRNDWTLHPNGTLSGPGGTRISLHDTSCREVTTILRQAWSHKVRQAITTRNGLSEVGIPDVWTTSKLLATFGSADQRVLARHVTGAFQTAASRALWQQDASPACPWCGQDETKAHRFLHCPAFQEIRAQHPVAVDAMEHAVPHWTYCPFAVLPPAVDILTMVFATRPMPRVPLDEALLLRQEGRRELRFYTDGTCRHPTVPFARHAAWSVLLDCSTCDAQRAQAEAFWQATGTVPRCFQVRSCGLVPGKQTVARAEALAALQAIRLAYHAGPIPVHVVTDSAYVVRLLSSLQLGQDVLALGLPANADILGLFREVWFQGVTVSKVKSHEDVCSISDSATRWDALGNSCVDAQCRKALQMDMPVVHDMVNAAAQEHDEQKFQLKAVYHYLLSLNYATNARMNQTQELSPATAVDRWVPPPVIACWRGYGPGNLQKSRRIYRSHLWQFLRPVLGDRYLPGPCGDGHSRCVGERHLTRTLQVQLHLNFSAIL